MQFGFETLGVVRLEARASVDNARGNRALQKLGAVPEGVLRKCFVAKGEYRDHVMWSMLVDDWRRERAEAPQGIVGEVA
jgi:RimJ/RimL family protein N-acetyltransferase